MEKCQVVTDIYSTFVLYNEPKLSVLVYIELVWYYTTKCYRRSGNFARFVLYYARLDNNKKYQLKPPNYHH